MEKKSELIIFLQYWDNFWESTAQVVLTEDRHNGGYCSTETREFWECAPESRSNNGFTRASALCSFNWTCRNKPSTTHVVKQYQSIPTMKVNRYSRVKRPETVAGIRFMARIDTVAGIRFMARIETVACIRFMARIETVARIRFMAR